MKREPKLYGPKGKPKRAPRLRQRKDDVKEHEVRIELLRAALRGDPNAIAAIESILELFESVIDKYERIDERFVVGRDAIDESAGGEPK